MKISIIILNYNSSADCRECVADLKRQEGVELDIVIVDNCSPREGEQDTIRQLCTDEGCTFIQAKENRGYNAGNNIGLRYAAEKGYKYALIANPDIRFPQKDYVVKMVKVMEEKPEVAVCGSDIVSPEGRHQNPRNYRASSWTDSFDWVTTALRRNDRKYDNVPNWIENPLESHDCLGLNGCCFLIRMDFVTQIGYFDEGVFLYGEEPILAHQVKSIGMKMRYEASIQAVHCHMKSKEPASAFCLKHWKHSRIHYVKKYSNYPWYGKLMAIFSLHLYFLSLSLSKKIKSRFNG